MKNVLAPALPFCEECSCRLRRAEPHLASVQAEPRLPPVGEHLPQRDPEHPGVGGVGEGAGLQGLRSTPGAGRRESEERLAKTGKPPSWSRHHGNGILWPSSMM